ncbi:MAG: hypothetical protein FWG56_03075 [Desulfovibrionaceae bacterium]|jgi:hypothetical protein|nr:hypothetical protein [Desulfovibrionaceae bacterium]
MDKYIVTLTPEERQRLQALVGKGRHAAQQVVSALILLNCDSAVHRDRRRLSSQELAEVLHIGARKIDRVKRAFVEEGLEVALRRCAAMLLLGRLSVIRSTLVSTGSSLWTRSASSSNGFIRHFICDMTLGTN